MKFIIEPINDTDCRITGVDCSGLQGQSLEEVTVPATVEQDGRTWQVKEVGYQVLFTNKSDDDAAKSASLRRLKRIVFSEGIEAINGVMCPNLINNADERGNAEFLKEVVLPSTLKKIGDRTFFSNKALETINIPSGLEEIGRNAFFGCESLPVFPWPKSLKKMGRYALEEMKYPTDENGTYLPVEIDIPDSIEVIDYSPYSCRVPIICHVSAKGWNALDNPPELSEEEHKMSTPPKLSSQIISIDIPEGVTEVSSDFSEVKHLTLPSTLEQIGSSVFNSWRSRLISLTELPAAIKRIGDSAFKDTLVQDDSQDIRMMAIPAGIEHIGENAFHHSGKIKLVADEATMSRLMGMTGALSGTAVEAIDIPEGATEVSVNDCPELTRLTIPSSVTRIIGITNCPKLKSLIIPDSVARIDKIYDLPSLAEFRLSKNVRILHGLGNIGEVKEVELPDTLESLKEDVQSWYGPFNNLAADIKASPVVWKLMCSIRACLQGYEPQSGSVTVPEGVEEITTYCFHESTVTNVVLPSTIRRLRGAAFEDCSKLETINMPEGVGELGESVFNGCRSLKKIAIPAKITGLPKKMAWSCTSLESVDFAIGSQLKEIGSGAFAGTRLKQLILPDGLTTLGGEVFKDSETLESITFPASMTDYGFRNSNWGSPTTPVVRCKNLKQVIFLADDPATAVYPVALGKLCDWYVPDSMVDHVKSFIEKAKAENSNVKGVGAKSVKPLSKLKGGATAEPKKKAPAKKAQAMTQQIKLSTMQLAAHYVFAVDEKDMPMLDSHLDRAILAVRYMRDKVADCSFSIEDRKRRDSTYVTEELLLDTQVNSATDKQWHCTPKTTITLDFANTAALPEEFPTAKAQELADKGGFLKLFASKCPNYGKVLAEGAPAYLEVKLNFDAVFDFMIGEKEKFNVKKITVMADWDRDKCKCWRFGLMYNGRYIPATSIKGDAEGFRMSLEASTDFAKLTAPPRFWSSSEDKSHIIGTSKGDNVDGVSFSADYYTPEALPFFNEILSLAK